MRNMPMLESVTLPSLIQARSDEPRTTAIFHTITFTRRKKAQLARLATEERSIASEMAAVQVAHWLKG